RPDADIFEAAQRAGRMIVTENVPDYLSLARTHQAKGGVHHGLALTTNRRFARKRADTVSRLVQRLAALEAKTADAPSNREDWL
ncbi:MAG: DUF5615 family PIN-like protein, partial [Actinomycetota bacterium]